MKRLRDLDFLRKWGRDLDNRITTGHWPKCSQKFSALRTEILRKRKPNWKWPGGERACVSQKSGCEYEKYNRTECGWSTRQAPADTDTSVSDTTDPDRRSQDSSSVRRSHVRVSLDYGKIERDLSTQMAVGGRHYGSGSGSGAEPSQSHKAKRIFQISFSSFELRPQKSWQQVGQFAVYLSVSQLVGWLFSCLADALSPVTANNCRASGDI